jgi:NAD+ synthetase
MSHIKNILEISRQDQVGPLSPWFAAQLEKSIQIGHYALPAQVQKDGEAIIDWLTKYREQTGCSTATMGISGGVDSALTAALLKRAGWRVLGYALPIHQDPTETERGREAAEALDIEFGIFDVSDTYDALVKSVAVLDPTLTDPNMVDDFAVKVRRGNIRARSRMIPLYNMAHRHNGLVASTDNLSELQAAFFTIHGDVGDISPIQAFNKGWEIPMLAKLFGVPEATWRAKPTDGLGISAGDEAQLGCTYLEWDLMFQAISTAHLIVSTLPAKKDFIIKLMEFDGDERAMQVFELVYGRAGRNWFKRMNPVNFEHPRLRTLQSLERTDRKLFWPEVVRSGVSS